MLCSVSEQGKSRKQGRKQGRKQASKKASKKASKRSGLAERLLALPGLGWALVGSLGLDFWLLGLDLDYHALWSQNVA